MVVTFDNPDKSTDVRDVQFTKKDLRMVVTFDNPDKSTDVRDVQSLKNHSSMVVTFDNPAKSTDVRDLQLYKKPSPTVVKFLAYSSEHVISQVPSLNVNFIPPLPPSKIFWSSFGVDAESITTNFCYKAFSIS